MIGVIDAGTTRIKLVVYDESRVVKVVREPITKRNPYPGWVEIDVEDLARKCQKLVDYAIEKYKIEAIAVTNQRTTAVMWDARSGKPLFPALGWQDMRAAKLADQLNRDVTLQVGRAFGKIVAKISEILPAVKNSRKARWLIAVSRFSLSPNHTSVKIRWMLDQLGDKVTKYDIKAGTIDSWLVYRLTGEHATDYSNAAATGIYDAFYMRWSRTVMEIIGIDETLLPETRESDSIFGEYRNVPVTGVIADQSASLYALGCWDEGQVKVTNGTGSFVDVNIGEQLLASTRGLMPLVAWKLKNETRYMLEGMVFYSGSAVDLMGDLGLYKDVRETSQLAFASKSDDVFLVPSFTGLGTPHYVTIPGLLYGISNAITREDIVKALLESIAFRIAEILEVMVQELPWELRVLRCDGEMSSNDFFLQRIADVTGIRVERAAILDATPFGAYMIAGRAIGKWKRDFCVPSAEIFTRRENAEGKYRRWKKLVEIAKSDLANL